MTKTLVATAEEPEERPRRVLEMQLTFVVELTDQVQVDKAISAAILAVEEGLGPHGATWFLQRAAEYRGKMRRSLWSYTRPKSMRRR